MSPRHFEADRPAETLRRAAALIRERAEVATPTGWLVDDDAPGVVMAPDEPGNTWDGVFICSTQIDERGEPNREDATHIASWHPAVALAVADWLEVQANEGWTGESLAVARTYLGESNA